MAKNQEVVLNVEGMTCGSCIRHVNSALRKVEGVKEVDVQLASGRVIVRHDSGTPDVGEMIEALRDAGYPSSAAA
ncbi:heavy-metal-associated domain-containing protein [Myxococcus sp. RHSTA-1-4]|uniref:heavy-metal-associated domain-containing protein n=1 Tax=Myxococcus sp. RHSTA-1-4 TaxID=2874601 RepID=UPI001CBD82E1|nr:heavy metal-associated domain-containing protein [Myxococcus sp. RHSTA-1-4]MBZ4415316.1 heavy-metal-associated domain-containing protein [Myxococcus sp. RHSTA-1-4]